MEHDAGGIVNRTNFEHAGYAALMQIVIGLLTGNWLAGAAFGFAFFLGREHAQYQILLGYNLKTTFQAFDIRNWSWDAKMDLLFPATTVTLIYVTSLLL